MEYQENYNGFEKFTKKWFRDSYKWLRKDIYPLKDKRILIIWDEL